MFFLGTLFLGTVMSPRYEPLPGKAVGVLVPNPEVILAEEGRSGPAHAVAFARGDGSYRWFYLPAAPGEKDTDTLTLPVGPTGKETRAFDNVVFADAAALKRRQLPANYALVEVEVNGGLGNPAEESFVATRIRVLDGSQEYPIKVAQVLDELKARYQAHRAGQKKEVEAQMAQAAQKALAGRKPTGPREESQTLFVTWLPKEERVRVTFRTTVTDGAYQRSQGAQGPREDSARSGTQFGVTLGMTYEVARSGQVAASQPIPSKTFVKELPPLPQRPPQRRH